LIISFISNLILGIFMLQHQNSNLPTPAPDSGFPISAPAPLSDQGTSETPGSGSIANSNSSPGSGARLISAPSLSCDVGTLDASESGELVPSEVLHREWLRAQALAALGSSSESEDEIILIPRGRKPIIYSSSEDEEEVTSIIPIVAVRSKNKRITCPSEVTEEAKGARTTSYPKIMRSVRFQSPQ
jgi:hypothetical protein